MPGPHACASLGRVSAAPLSGVRVLDVSHTLAGPLAAMHLGDLGAEVVRLERPEGDPWREHEGVPGHPGRSRHHLQANRNKRSVAVDLAREEGQEVAHRLVRWADVLVTNLRPGVPERLGLGWEACEALNPRLVYCSVTGFGEGGPIGGRGGYDLVVQGRAGLMARAGADDPVPCPLPVTDTALPLVAATGIMAALLERERSGRGQRVDCSLLGAAVALNAHTLVRLEDVGEPGVVRFAKAFHRPYRTADGWIAVAAYAERLARRFCAVVGLPGLLDDPRYADRADRAARDDELAAAIGPRMRGRTTAEWDALLADAGVPAGPVRDRYELYDDPQARESGLFAEVQDAELGRVTMAAPVARLSRTPGAIRFPGRGLGEDTRSVLREVGYDDAAVARLAAAGVVVAGDPEILPG